MFFRLKHILFQGKEYKIFMQSANGPCPLIAIGTCTVYRRVCTVVHVLHTVNALILKGLVSAADKYEEVTSEGVISFLMSYIRSHVKLVRNSRCVDVIIRVKMKELEEISCMIWMILNENCLIY